MSQLVHTDLIRIGYEPGDDARTQRGKTMSVLVVTLVLFATIIFSLESGRSTAFRILDATSIFAEIASIFVLQIKKRTQALFWTMIPPLITVQFLFLLMNGNREGDILVFLLVPVAAVVVFGPENSRPWFWVCFLALLTVPFWRDNYPTGQQCWHKLLRTPMAHCFIIHKSVLWNLVKV